MCGNGNLLNNEHLNSLHSKQSCSASSADAQRFQWHRSGLPSIEVKCGIFSRNNARSTRFFLIFLIVSRKIDGTALLVPDTYGKSLRVIK